MDVNDKAPTFNKKSYVASVLENMQKGMPISFTKGNIMTVYDRDEVSQNKLIVSTFYELPFGNGKKKDQQISKSLKNNKHLTFRIIIQVQIGLETASLISVFSLALFRIFSFSVSLSFQLILYSLLSFFLSVKVIPCVTLTWNT